MTMIKSRILNFDFSDEFSVRTPASSNERPGPVPHLPPPDEEAWPLPPSIPACSIATLPCLFQHSTNFSSFELLVQENPVLRQGKQALQAPRRISRARLPSLPAALLARRSPGAITSTSTTVSQPASHAMSLRWSSVASSPLLFMSAADLIFPLFRPYLFICCCNLSIRQHKLLHKLLAVLRHVAAAARPPSSRRSAPSGAPLLLALLVCLLSPCPRTS